jgi:hypothetical protein
MSKTDELDDALTLAEGLCTSEQIKDLLRKRKGNENVRITAESKEDLIHRNLRDAVAARAIDVGEVYDLIRLAEETGNQHIFYYRPKTKRLAEALTYEFVARQLWGSAWEKKVAEFPSIRLKPNDYRYADFRQFSKKPKDWILKIYGQNVVTRFTGKTEQRGQSLWREYVDEPLRIVLSARWNSPDLLEIRVQRNESRRRIEEWLNRVWAMLSPALVLGQFDPWNLQPSMARIILEHEKHATLYTFRDASIDDMGVHASFQAFEDDGDLFASQRSIDAIKSYVRADGDCKALAVTWLANPNAAPQKEIRTLLGARAAGETIVSGHCLPGDLDYVTDQLRSLSKAAS